MLNGRCLLNRRLHAMQTFEEWFNQNYHHDDDYDFKEELKDAWEAGYEQGLKEHDDRDTDEI